MAGLSVGRREHKLGQRAADAAEVVLEDVFVPERRVIGGIGRGWAIHQALSNLSRPVTAALALGIARGAFEQARQFCQTTTLAGRSLSDYQEVQLALADMSIKLDAMRATLWRSAGQALPAVGAMAGAKVFCSEASWQICQGAMDVLGDHGFLHSQGVEKAARDARLTLIAAGTNEINRLAVFEALAGEESPLDGPGRAQ
jgi:alkylation response protein AidB-like acyl-CoA dehydrogenase